jgi:hypothetical protein
LKALIAVLALLAAFYSGIGEAGERTLFADASSIRSDAISTAFREKRSDVPVAGEGIVARILPDDNDGRRHQRFILNLASGQTLLVAHNIDLAPRVAPLNVGDRIEFTGVYEWNSKGGTIHWTHRDPGGRRAAGWLKRNGQIFQ